jgi:hypothetical protein
MGLGVTGSAEPWIASTRPLMLQGGNDGVGIGDVEHDDRLEVRAGARLLEREAAARAIADRRLLRGIEEAELVRLGKKRVVGLATAGDGEGKVAVHGAHAGRQLLPCLGLVAVA